MENIDGSGWEPGRMSMAFTNKNPPGQGKKKYFRKSVLQEINHCADVRLLPCLAIRGLCKGR